MEQAFPLEIFRKQGNTFRGIPLFSVSPELPENHCTIYFITLMPCFLAKKYAILLEKMASSFMFQCPTCGFQCINMDAFIAHSCATSGER